VPTPGERDSGLDSSWHNVPSLPNRSIRGNPIVQAAYSDLMTFSRAARAHPKVAFRRCQPDHMRLTSRSATRSGKSRC
jgi:hypothetical protein